MKSSIGVGDSVGVLAGLWTQVSIDLALVTWVAFVASWWAGPPRPRRWRPAPEVA